MSTVRMVTANISIVLGGRILSFVAQLAVTMLLARIISVEAFGVVALCSAAVAFGQVLSMAGLGPALVQRQVITQRHRDAAMGVTYILAAVCLGAGLVTGPWFVDLFGLARHLILFQFVVFAIPCGALTSVSQSLLQRDYHFRDLSLVEVGSYIIGYGVPATILALAGYEEWALAIALVSQAALKMVVLQVLAYKKCSLRVARLHFGTVEVRDLARFGVGYSAGSVASFFSSQGDYLVVGRFFTPSVVALYTRGYQLIALPANLVGYALDSVLFPVLSRIQDDHKRLSEFYFVGLTLIAVVFVPVSMGIAFAAEDLVLVLLGANWLGMVSILVVLSGFTFFRMAYKLTDSITRALGVVNQRAALKIIYGLLVVGGALWGSRWGIESVAWFVGIAVVANYAFMNMLVFKYIPFRLNDFLLSHLRGVAVGVPVLALWALWKVFGLGGLSPGLALFLFWMLTAGISGALVLGFPRFVLGGKACGLMIEAGPSRVINSAIFKRVRAASDADFSV